MPESVDITITGPSYPTGSTKTITALSDPAWTASWLYITPGDYIVTVSNEQPASDNWTIPEPQAVTVGISTMSQLFTELTVTDYARLGSLEATLDVKAQNFHEVLKQDFHNELKQDFHNELKQDFHNELAQDYHNELAQDYHNELKQDFHNELAQDYHNELAQDYHNELAQDFHNELAQDYHNVLKQDFHDEYVPVFEKYVTYSGTLVSGITLGYGTDGTSGLPGGYLKNGMTYLKISNIGQYDSDNPLAVWIADSSPQNKKMSPTEYNRNTDFMYELYVEDGKVFIEIVEDDRLIDMDFGIQVSDKAFTGNPTSLVKHDNNPDGTPVMADSGGNTYVFFHSGGGSWYTTGFYEFVGWEFLQTVLDGDPYFFQKVLDGDPYLFQKVLDGDPYFFQKVLDGDTYFFQKVLDGDPYFFQKVLDGDPCLFQKVLDGDPYFFQKVLDGDPYFFQKVLDGIPYSIDDFPGEYTVTLMKGASAIGTATLTKENKSKLFENLESGDYTVILTLGVTEIGRQDVTVNPGEKATAAFTDIIDGVQGEDVIFDGVKGADVIVDGVKGDDVIIDGIKGEDVIIDGIKGEDVIIDGIKGDDVIVDGVKGDDVIIDGIKGADVIVDGIKGDDVTVDGVKGADVIVDGVKGADVIVDGVKGTDVIVDGIKGADVYLGSTDPEYPESILYGTYIPPRT